MDRDKDLAYVKPSKNSETEETVWEKHILPDQRTLIVKLRVENPTDIDLMCTPIFDFERVKCGAEEPKFNKVKKILDNFSESYPLIDDEEYKKQISDFLERSWVWQAYGYGMGTNTDIFKEELPDITAFRHS